RRIQDTSRDAERILDSLLDLTRLDLTDVGVNVSDFAAADLLDHVGTTFAPLARERRLALRIRRSTAIVRSGPVWLERILFNFVGNAIRYSTRGGVLVGCRRRGPFLSFDVWDTGPGIPQHRLEEIFEEFVQLDSGRRDDSRRGFG